MSEEDTLDLEKAHVIFCISCNVVGSLSYDSDIFPSNHCPLCGGSMLWAVRHAFTGLVPDDWNPLSRLREVRYP